MHANMARLQLIKVSLSVWELGDRWRCCRSSQRRHWFIPVILAVEDEDSLLLVEGSNSKHWTKDVVIEPSQTHWQVLTCRCYSELDNLTTWLWAAGQNFDQVSSHVTALRFHTRLRLIGEQTAVSSNSGRTFACTEIAAD